MPSLTAKDRAPLCRFTYEDGRLCRTPRTRNHRRFCFYHAQKENRARTTEALAKDLDYLFSGDYLSACDLSSALSRLIPAVLRGHLQPKLARTVAYMCQTLVQSIYISQREYATAFGADGLRKTLRHSVNAIHDHLFPPDPEPADADSEPAAQQPAQAFAPSPIPPATSTSVGAGLARPFRPSRPTRSARPPLPNSPTLHAPSTPTPSNATPPQPPTVPKPSPTQTAAITPPAPTPIVATPPTAPLAPQPKPATPTRDPYAVHFDHNYRLRADDKPF